MSICVLRGLLLKTVDPDKWEQFVELDSKQEQRRKQDESTYDLAVAFIQKTCRQTQFDANEIDFVGVSRTHFLSIMSCFVKLFCWL